MTAARRWQLLLTCEHASNAVPAALRSCFDGKRAVLRSHRGYDIGALAVAQQMARVLHAPLLAGGITRLLVDLNRSARHRQVHSEFAESLAAPARAALIEQWHTPFRAAAWAALQRLAAVGPVLHVSVHSFTPVWQGEARNCDIGLLYDPQRRGEQPLACALARALRAQEELRADDDGLRAQTGVRLHKAAVAARAVARGTRPNARALAARTAALPALRVRMNYPYRGNADGHTTSLRRMLPDARYLGIEIELNQALLQRDNMRRAIADRLITALQGVVAQ